MTERKDNSREFTRYPVALSAEVLVHGRIYVASTKDISEGGVGLVTREPLPEGQNISLMLFITQDGIEDPDSEPLDVAGSIVWTAEQETGGHVAGARFGALNKEQQSRLNDLISELADSGSGNAHSEVA